MGGGDCFPSGHLSWGHMDGSWLFKELCPVLEGAHTELDLLQMTTVAAGLVACKYETYVDGRPELGKVKQMPEIHSTLTKLLRFSNKSKK
ncbi:hypothetical protein MSG28_001317 [Choristoneura fumiferana]|uniref:Uncharacterized protein n=1 Tax=Choristoneura fumiferana TaxID=7141 RepID=A0ACC0KTM2_CHOFU|nr:hypothetical protein MSG28_001317 [Choristoneura fumiferana]